MELEQDLVGDIDLIEGLGWECFEAQDAFQDEPQSQAIPAGTPEELAMCRATCISLGYGAFTVRRGMATFRPHCRREVLEEKTSGFRDRGATLHVAPDVKEAPADGVLIALSVIDEPADCDGSPDGDESRTLQEGSSNLSFAKQRAAAATLASNSGYFEALFRHDWADGKSDHTFAEFPGGERAFEFAVAWLVRERCSAIGEPWPVKDCDTVCSILAAAAYLDAPRLLRAAVRSWRCAFPRGHVELLQVSHAIANASLQFAGKDKENLIQEIRATLQELPKHQLLLSAEFLVAPAAGLAVLEMRLTARDNLVGHIKKFGGWVGSAVGSVVGHGPSSIEQSDDCLSIHDFVTRLFAAHEAFFLEHLDSLRKLLIHVDPTVPIPTPLCFRLAAASAVATSLSDGEVFAGERLAVDIFSHGLRAAEDPAEAAADDSCVIGLFGAGSKIGNDTPCGRSYADASTSSSAASVFMALDVLAGSLVPPAAAGVILSRVLSSWAVAGSRREDAEAPVDAADVILAAVADDRQRLRTLLQAALPRIAAELGGELARGWGSSFDYAVPELRAAFARAAQLSLESGRSARASDETLRLLFRIVYQPSGGLPGTRFPLSLLGELRSHNSVCTSLVTQRVLAELRSAAESDLAHAWALAEALWPTVAWESVDIALIEEVISILRSWLLKAKNSVHSATRAEQKAHAVRLLRQLPIENLSDPQAVLAPPIPAHVLAGLAFKMSSSGIARLAVLEAENAELREIIAHLQASK